MCHSECVHGCEHTNQSIYQYFKIQYYTILNYDAVRGMALRKKMLEIMTAGGLCYCGVKDVSLSPETDSMEGII